MLKIYLDLVRSILGGYRDQVEVDLVTDCFYKALTTSEAAQVVINNR